MYVDMYVCRFAYLLPGEINDNRTRIQLRTYSAGREERLSSACNSSEIVLRPAGCTKVSDVCDVTDEFHKQINIFIN